MFCIALLIRDLFECLILIPRLNLSTPYLSSLSNASLRANGIFSIMNFNFI